MIADGAIGQLTAMGDAQAERIARLEGSIKMACDLLAERIHGNAARSPGHNARVILESALNPSGSRGGGMSEHLELVRRLRAKGADEAPVDPKATYATKPRELLDEAAAVIESQQWQIENLFERLDMWVDTAKKWQLECENKS